MWPERRPSTEQHEVADVDTSARDRDAVERVRRLDRPEQAGAQRGVRRAGVRCREERERTGDVRRRHQRAASHIPAEKPQLVPWVGLQEQFGQGYAYIRRFREFFAGLLPQIRAAYPDARFDTDGRGMTLFQSPPSVRKRLVAVGRDGAIGGAAARPAMPSHPSDRWLLSP